MRPIAGRWHLFCSWSEAPECFQKVAELTPCRRAARRAALPLCEGENKAAHFIGSFSPSQRGRRERSERGGRFGDFLCKAQLRRGVSKCAPCFLLFVLLTGCGYHLAGKQLNNGAGRSIAV